MKRIIYLTTLVLFLGSCASTHQHTDLEYPDLNPYQIPEIEKFTLDNGITFYLVEDDEVPLINLTMIVRGGSFMETDDKVGLASIMTNVMRNGGSETYPEEELNELLENKAAQMEFGMSFTSGNGRLNVLKEDFEELLPVLMDVMQNPLFPQEKIDLAITQRRSAISRRNDNAQQIANREFERLIYGKDSPQGRLVEYATLENISREDLIAFHENTFGGQNLKIGLVGDFSASEMREMLENIFNDYPAGTRNEIDLPEIDYEFDSSINFVDKRDVNQSVVFMGHIGGLRDNPDYAALQAMNEVLSGGFSGRLFQVVRSEMGLAYAVFGSYGSNVLYPGQFYAGLMTRSETTADAISATRQEMIRLQEEPVSEEELRETKDAILNSLVFRYDSKSRVLNERMRNDYLGLPEDAFEQYIEELHAVTPEDIQRVAQEYMRPENMRILVVGHGGEIGDQLEQFGEVNEIDITIPRPGAERPMAEGDSEAGSEWLGRMSEAVLNGNEPAGYTSESQYVEFNPQYPGGQMTMDMKIMISFPDELVQEIDTPQGVLTITYKDGSATMAMMGQEQNLPPVAVESIQGQLKRSYIHLAVASETIDAVQVGTTEEDGKELVELALGEEQDIILYLDASTALPYKLAYSDFDMQQGTEVETVEYYSDWQEYDGVNVAQKVEVKTEGETSGEVTYKSFSFN